MLKPISTSLVSAVTKRYLSSSAARYGKSVVQGPSAVSGGHEGGYKLWRNLTLFVAFPAIALCGLNCYMSHEHHAERPPWVKYEYLAIRHKRYPWGTGDKSFFHNPHLNALSDGYEDVTTKH